MIGDRDHPQVAVWRTGAYMRRTAITVAAILAIAAPGARSDVITVEPSGAGDYPTIQEGLSAAADGDTVLVEPGTYVGPDNRDLDFGGKNIRLRSSGGRDVTVIDCEDFSRAFHLHGGEDTTATVNGFTVINGHASKGGAARIVGASLTVKDCAFQQCRADSFGSALYIEGENGFPRTRRLVVTDCAFSGNSTRYGGAVCCFYGTLAISSCEFRDNTSSPGACGISCSESVCYASDCLFTENEKTCVYWSETDGEVRRCSFEYNATVSLDLRQSNALVSECTFRRNRGSGISIVSCSPLVDHCLFMTNYTIGVGAGIRGDHASPVVVDCTFVNSHAFGSHSGHAIHLENTDVMPPVITDCTVFGRVDWYSPSSGVFHFVDCDPIIQTTVIAFSGNRPIYCEGTATPTTTRCIVFAHAEGDSLCGNHYDNLFTEPLWCNVYNEDFEVCDNSPCLPENNPWGVQIGAYGEGCGECITAVKEATWGSIKAMYR